MIQSYILLMANRKPKTPEQIAKESVKKSYSISVNKSSMEELIKISRKQGVPYSLLVEEAISWYLEAIKEQKR